MSFVTAASTIDTFSLNDTEEDNNDIKFTAEWSGGYPPFQYEVREQSTLKVVKSGTVEDMRAEGVIEDPGDGQFTIRVTDAGGDIISTTTSFIG